MAFQKGNIPWNVGIPRDEATKLKISKTRSGRGLGYKIGNTIWLGKKHTEESKLKMGIRQLGDKNHSWKLGRRKVDGYVMLLRPEHPFADKKGYFLEHRLVIEEVIGRYLTRVEEVHHINEIRDDNRIENLILFDSKNEHQKHHQQLLKVS